ncbi:MAG: hypothetical protein WCT20_03525 [Candidatus Babeliales bacterium]
MKRSHGSIIVIALLMLSVIMLLTQQLIRNVYVGSQFIQTMIERQQAEVLAIGGIKLAIAELTHNPGDQKSQKVFLSRVLPHLNRWQTFDLHEAIDGIDGQVKLCISAEDGKLNINEIFDFKKQEFKPDYDGRLKALEIHGTFKSGEIHTKLLEYLKKRQRKLDDITELSAVDGLNQIDVLYHPPTPPATKKDKEMANDIITLQDMFTTWTTNDKINVLWLSDALCAAIGLDRPMANDAVRKQEDYKKIVTDLKPEMAQDWDAHWKTLEPIYGSKPKPEAMNSLKNIFSKEFEPKVYSVLSYGKVGQAEQTLLVVVKLTKEEKVDEESGSNDQADATQKNKTKSSDKPKEKFKILRLYWL